MKSNKPKVQKKVAKKAAKKDLENSLTEKFMQAINQLSEEAERIGLDIKKVGKRVSKEIIKKFSPEKEALVKPKKKDKSVAAAAQAPKTLKRIEKAQKALKNATTESRSQGRSVKVVPIVTEEKVAQAIAKPVKEVVATPIPPKIAGTRANKVKPAGDKAPAAAAAKPVSSAKKTTQVRKPAVKKSTN